MKEAKLNAKISVVNEIKEKIEAAKAIVLVDHRGLDATELTELRKLYKEEGVEYKVYKNTMMRRAFESAGVEGIEEGLKGPSAIAFSDDEVAAARVSYNYGKTHEKLDIKMGIVDGKIYGTEEVKSLGQIPSKDVLIAKLLGGLNAPIQSLAIALNAIKDKLSEGQPEEVKEEETKEEAPVEETVVEEVVAEESSEEETPAE